VFEAYEDDSAQEVAGVRLGPLAAFLLRVLVAGTTTPWLEDAWRLELPRGVAVCAGAEALAESIGVDLAWLDFLRQSSDLSLEALLESLPAQEGLAGRLLALRGVGAIEFRALRPLGEALPRAIAQREHARRVIQKAYARSREAHYFELLGLRVDADSVELQRVFDQRCAQLLVFDLPRLDAEDLEALRRDTLETYAEARRALADPTTRLGYAKALGLL
jgi:hypothetical protein